MQQQFKTIYFPSENSIQSEKHSLTLSFRKTDLELFEKISRLSSFSIREIIGHNSLSSLENAAKKNNESVSSYCRQLLYQKLIQPNYKKNNQYFHDKLQATFSGGKGHPLHEWYPYLEGYSPSFVKNILHYYASSASVIFDPFGGSGTTPLTTAFLGKRGYFCEINPVCQFVIQVKLEALRLSDHDRVLVHENLLKISEDLPKLLKAMNPDPRLRDTYKLTFGSSEFFDAISFDYILRSRSLIDHISSENNKLALFVTIAFLRSLIPSSKLIRRGDLRFKTKAENEYLKTDYIYEVKNSLCMISKDIIDLGFIDAQISFLTADAKDAYIYLPKDIDAIITSPPYLNGTNYFRNTKIDLWFLRKLNSNNELREYRYRAVTAGINDVTVKKTKEREFLYNSTRLNNILSCLRETAYDKRIPDMVSSYFGDLYLVFNSIISKINPGTILAIDIGDSCYGNVHVPTDEIFCDLLQEQNCVSIDKILLRERLSRSGYPLQQILHIFKKDNEKKIKKQRDYDKLYSWHERWIKFKNELPHQKADMAKRNWGHKLHSLCSYQGKLKPAIAKSLVDIFVPHGGTILDPFGGVGTIPFEAALLGRKSFTFEISPAAFYIAKAKLIRSDPQKVFDIVQNLENYIKDFDLKNSYLKEIKKIKFNGFIKDYFHNKTFSEIIAARNFFKEYPPGESSAALVFSSLLHILHGNRPYALSRRSHPITPFSPSGNKEYRNLMQKLSDKINRSLSVEYPEDFKDGSVYFQDAVKPWPEEIRNLDAIITSPPFFDSTKFYTANWMRLWFSGWESEDFHIKPLDFIDVKQKKSFDVYNPILKLAFERLKKTGVLVLHLGESRKCNMSEKIKNLSKEWFKVEDEFSESVAHCKSHGIRDQGSVTAHQYLVLTPI